MKNTTKRILSVLCAIVLIVSVFPAATASAATVANVGSLWDGFEAGSGTFTVTAESRVYVVSSTEPTGNLLQTAQLIQRELKAQFSDCSLDLVWGPADWTAAGDIVLALDTASGTGADGYRLDVDEETATVTAADVDGLIYGANSLIKCFRAVGGNSISGFSGNDSPDTAERTISLDCGRKYYTAEWICNFVRQMSWMGYNTLQLHFSEDGGFRADFWDPAYYTDGYRPTNDFSWLCGSKTQYWVYDGNKNNENYNYTTDPDAGKYLTMKELIEICEVAAEYHIDIIPSFDSPAHMDYITWRYEQYAKSNGFTFTYGGKSYTANSGQNYCINYTGTTGKDAPTRYYAGANINPGTVAEAFVLALYEDIADFFKVYANSTDFSIGADEVGQGSSVKWGYDTFVSYINKLNKILNGKGYTMRMYNDFLGSTTYNYSSTTSSSCKYTFDSNIEIMYWDSPFNQIDGGTNANTVKASVLANQGRTLYNCIQSNCYYVLRVANASSVSSDYKYMDARNSNNLNWSFNYSTEEQIYNTWTPNDFGEKGKYSTTDVVANNKVGGAYFLIWNDYAALNTEAEVWNGVYDNTGTSSEYYSLFDRMWSNTAKMWNWDLDRTVTYTSFQNVRNTFGWFPGFTSCSADAKLPAKSAITAAQQPETDDPIVPPVDPVDRSELEAALAAVKTEQGEYTNESWEAYQEAVRAAEAVNADPDATAEQVAAAVANLKAAEVALVIPTGGAQIIDIRKLSATAVKGKKVGLVITTTTDATAVSIKLNGQAVKPDLCLTNIQTISDEEVRVWMINFPATVSGNCEVTVSGGATQTVSITVK